MDALTERAFAISGVGTIGRIPLQRLRLAAVPARRIVVCDSDLERGQADAKQQRFLSADSQPA